MPSLDYIPKAVQCGVAGTLCVVVPAGFVLLLVTGVSVGGQFLLGRYGFVLYEQLAADLRDPRTIALVIAIGVEFWYFGVLVFCGGIPYQAAEAKLSPSHHGDFMNHPMKEGVMAT